MYPIIWRKVSFSRALALMKRSDDFNSVLHSDMALEMKRVVSRLWERMPVTRSLSVFSNMVVYYIWVDGNPPKSSLLAVHA